MFDTLNPVYNNHSRDQVMVVFVDRWSLYRGALVSLRWLMEYPTVVTIDRWPFYTSDLCRQVHCTCCILRWPMDQPAVAP